MRKKLLVISIILLAAVLLSACGGAVRGTSWPGLSASGDVAYLADGPYVYAVNLKDGKELWHYPLQASKQVFYSAPVVTADGLVIVGSAANDHELIAIDPKKFSAAPVADVGGLQRFFCSIGLAVCPEPVKLEAWTFTEAKDHWVAAPLIIGDKLFAPNADGNLYVLDLADGRSIKTIELGGRLWGQPVTDGERVFVTSLDHSVYAVDTETYEVVWQKDLAGAIPGSPAIGSDGMLYVGSLASQLEKFDPATGTHEPVLALDAKNLIWSTPVSDEDALYFGDLEGNFYSFNTSTGELNWPPIQPDGPITATPLVLGDNILLATESGSIFEVDQNGSSKLWSQPGGKIYTTPVLADDLILVAPLGADAYLYAYNQDGSPAWLPFVPGK